MARFILNKIIKSSILIILIFVFIEIIMRVLYLSTKNVFFSRDYLSKQLALSSNNRILDISDYQKMRPEAVKQDILHPYLGFVRNDTDNQYTNQYGFTGSNPIQRKASDRLIIGIFGGSFAEGLYGFKDVLINKLNAYTKFKDKKIEIISLALEGFKQPQQLLVLNYILALNGQFDIIINLDGFNEISIPSYNHDINPIYPRSWNFFSQESLDLPSILQIQKLSDIREKQYRLKSMVLNTPLRRSIIIMQILYFLNQKQEHDFNKLYSSFETHLDNKTSSRQTKGPDFRSEIHSSEDYLNKIVEIWATASIQMDKLSKANNILYLHFLQPNQYFTNSKPLSNDEKKIMHLENFQSITEGYKKLIDKAKVLKANGENFYDLSMIFKNNIQTLYVDDCCHINKHGYDIITDEIIRIFNEKIDE